MDMHDNAREHSKGLACEIGYRKGRRDYPIESQRCLASAACGAADRLHHGYSPDRCPAHRPSIDVQQLGLAVSQMLSDLQRILEVRRDLHLGAQVMYFNDRRGTLAPGRVLQRQGKRRLCAVLSRLAGSEMKLSTPQGRGVQPASLAAQFQRQEVVDAVHRMIGDMRQHTVQPGFGVDSDQPGRSDQPIHGRSAFATAVGAGKQEVAPA
jgi:hypothetical protein